ncbi:13488_t:CDS:2 [Acaulospora morrowiae]|uniref:13488_t:CDS:1 n=1 Tax=Acaulospora morrowiae TaxID=94023 RepID=A0A9N9AGB6_9GLOM|nr:13488_t:CDS:2 [Acaulospora morrowiae]
MTEQVSQDHSHSVNHPENQQPYLDQQRPLQLSPPPQALECVICPSLKSQNEFKEILVVKYHKIAQVQDELIQSQRNLIRDLLLKSSISVSGGAGTTFFHGATFNNGTTFNNGGATYGNGTTPAFNSATGVFENGVNFEGGGGFNGESGFESSAGFNNGTISVNGAGNNNNFMGDYAFNVPYIGDADLYGETNFLRTLNYDVQQAMRSSPQCYNPQDWRRIYVGAVTNDVDEKTLRKILGKAFGKVTSIEIVRARSCAFVEFCYQEAYQRAIKQGFIYLNGVRAKIKMAHRPNKNKRFNNGSMNGNRNSYWRNNNTNGKSSNDGIANGEDSNEGANANGATGNGASVSGASVSGSSMNGGSSKGKSREITEGQAPSILPVDFTETVNTSSIPTEHLDQFILPNENTVFQHDCEMTEEYIAPSDSKMNPLFCLQEPIYQLEDFSAVTASWFWSSYLPSIMNSMPYFPSDHINDIVEVDFPKDLSVSTFYQLLSQMTLLGQGVFNKCTILRMLSVGEWNRKYSFFDYRPQCKWNVDGPGSQEVEPGEVIDELVKEYWHDQGSSDNSDNTVPSSPTSNGQNLKGTLGQCEQNKQGVELEIVVHGQYLTPQSELFQKIYHYLSNSIFFRPHPCGKYATRITMPIPSVSTIGPIINWLYNHNDNDWMETMTPENFDQVSFRITWFHS